MKRLLHWRRACCVDAMVDREILKGLWRRALLRRPGRRDDVETEVRWLQGQRFFIDLRQPPARPDFAGARCVRDFDDKHLSWLAKQEGFAGELLLAGDVAEWRREIDFQPLTPFADRARLAWTGSVLAETGLESDYFEEWRRAPISGGAAFGLRLTAPGLSAYLLRNGAVFMYARPRAHALAAGGDLTKHLAAASDRLARQALVDFEISFGEVCDGSWRVTHSSLPFKEDTALLLCMDAEGGTLVVHDIDPKGAPIIRHWRIAERDCESAAGLAQLLQDSSA